MRRITDHAINPTNEALTISVLDEPGQGGASHVYTVSWHQTKATPQPHELKGQVGPVGLSYDRCCPIYFQNGPIQTFGVNGVTQESLLAIVIDRLRSFQAGSFSCRENAVALTHCECALLWLQKRTRDRMARGVEGTNQQ